MGVRGYPLYSTIRHKIISEKGRAFQKKNLAHAETCSSSEATLLREPLESFAGVGSQDTPNVTVRAAQSLSGIL